MWLIYDSIYGYRSRANKQTGSIHNLSCSDRTSCLVRPSWDWRWNMVEYHSSLMLGFLHSLCREWPKIHHFTEELSFKLIDLQLLLVLMQSEIFQDILSLVIQWPGRRFPSAWDMLGCWPPVAPCKASLMPQVEAWRAAKSEGKAQAKKTYKALMRLYTTMYDYVLCA